MSDIKTEHFKFILTLRRVQTTPQRQSNTRGLEKDEFPSQFNANKVTDLYIVPDGN